MPIAASATATSRRTIQPASKRSARMPPRRLAAIPIRAVASSPICCLPGSTRRPSAPMISPVIASQRSSKASPMSAPASSSARPTTIRMTITTARTLPHVWRSADVSRLTATRRSADGSTAALRLLRLLQLLQGAAPVGAAGAAVRARADRHLRRRHADRRVRRDQPAADDARPRGRRPLSAGIERDPRLPRPRGRFLPDDPFALAEVMRWLVYEQTDVIPTIAGLRFRLLVGRLTPTDPEAVSRKNGVLEVLRLLEDHLSTRKFFAGGRYTIADIALYAYTHRADEAGIDLRPYSQLRAWFGRVEAQPGYLEDVEPYGANAAPGAGRSLYD